jgi:hypothetical protein
MRRAWVILLVLATGCSAQSSVSSTTLSTTATTVPVSPSTAPPVTSTTTSAILITSTPHVEESSDHRINAVVPSVTGIAGAADVDAAISDTINGIVDEFMLQSEQNGTTPGLGQNSLDITYTAGYLSVNLLSIEIETSTYWSGAAHPFETVATLTFLDGRVVDIAAYLTDPSGLVEIIAADVARRYQEGSAQDVLATAGGTESLLDSARFLLTPDALVAAFDQYAVAAGAAGIVRVEIPYERASLGGPLAGLPAVPTG